MKQTIRYSDGVVYEGEVNEQGQPNGRGRMLYPSGMSIDGTFLNGLLNGDIVFAWPGGQWLEGFFSMDFFQGKGRMHYPDGSVYEGEIGAPSDGWPSQGKGKLIDSDGTVYEGTFEDNQMHGQCTITYPDGGIEICEYEYGQVKNILQPRSRTLAAVPAVSPEDVIDKERFLFPETSGETTCAEELRPYFAGLIGMDSVKSQLDRIYKRFKIDGMRQKMLGMQAQKQGYYFIITGNPGTGKTTVARIIGKMLFDTGILPRDTFIETDRSGLVGEYIGQTEKKTAEIIAQIRGGTLFIDEAYNLYRKDSPNDFGKEAVDTLLKDMEDHRGEYAVILAGYQQEINEMIRSINPGLASRFDHKIEIPDYSASELLSILVTQAVQKKLFIEKDAKSAILARIEKEKVDETFDNARFARRLLDEAIERQALRLSEEDSITADDLQILKAADFGTAASPLQTLDAALARLDGLTGLENVKKQIHSIVQSARIQAEGRRRGLQIGSGNIPLSMVFTGNPGTGKTTVARLVGNIYYQLGLLKRDQVFVECVRADLVGRYQGETALKVKEVVKKALGGVLFIDEAYSLVSGSGDTFGMEAVNTLVSEMENNRDKLVVILAGYTREMNQFLDANPGLRSRLSRQIEFEDYTPDQLRQIMKSDLTGRGYLLQADDSSLDRLILTHCHEKDFGNARGVRNLCDNVVMRHNDRIEAADLSALSDEDFITLTDTDFA